MIGIPSTGGSDTGGSTDTGGGDSIDDGEEVCLTECCLKGIGCTDNEPKKDDEEKEKEDKEN